MVAAPSPVMPITQTTETTASSAKRVCRHVGLSIWAQPLTPVFAGCLLTTRHLVCVSSVIVEEIKRIIKTSEVMKEDDSKWPRESKEGKQELEIQMGSEHISFVVGSSLGMYVL